MTAKREHHTVDDLTEQMRQQDRAEQEKYGDNNKFRTEGFAFTHVSKLLRDIKPTDWLIYGFLEAESLSVLFGESGTFKTFMSLSWALSIACGKPWFGHEVKQGPVFFIIGEGQNGFAKRVKAWGISKAVDLSDCPFYVSKKPVMMLDVNSARSAGDAINNLREKHGKPALVVIDTLARNFGPGDENSTSDMTAFIANLDEYIGRDFTRLVVHHTGQGNKDRARGSYALLAAVDAEYRLTKKDDVVTMSCTKMKDGEKFDDMSFKPRTIEIGSSPVLMTSLVLDQVTQQRNEIKLSPQMRQAISLLESLQHNSAEKCRSSLNDWREICVEEKVYQRTAFYNATKTLEEKGIITISDGCVCLS